MEFGGGDPDGEAGLFDRFAFVGVEVPVGGADDDADLDDSAGLFGFGFDFADDGDRLDFAPPQLQ